MNENSVIVKYHASKIQKKRKDNIEFKNTKSIHKHFKQALQVKKVKLKY